MAHVLLHRSGCPDSYSRCRWSKIPLSKLSSRSRWNYVRPRQSKLHRRVDRFCQGAQGHQGNRYRGPPWVVVGLAFSTATADWLVGEVLLTSLLLTQTAVLCVRAAMKQIITATTSTMLMTILVVRFSKTTAMHQLGS